MGKTKKEKISLFRIKGSQQRDIGLQGCMRTSASVHFPPIYSKISGEEWENNERRPRVTTFLHPYCLCMTKAGHISGRTSRSVACLLSHFSPAWLCDSMDCSLPGASVHGILQTRMLERVAMPLSRFRKVELFSLVPGRYRTSIPGTSGGRKYHDPWTILLPVASPRGDTSWTRTGLSRQN